MKFLVRSGNVDRVVEAQSAKEAVVKVIETAEEDDEYGLIASCVRVKGAEKFFHVPNLIKQLGHEVEVVE